MSFFSLVPGILPGIFLSAQDTRPSDRRTEGKKKNYLHNRQIGTYRCSSISLQQCQCIRNYPGTDNLPYTVCLGIGKMYRMWDAS